MSRIGWSLVLATASTVVVQYATDVTLRQLHYRLFSIPELGYPNSEYAYKRLSTLTAARRRAGTFPSLADLTRSIALPWSYASPEQALAELAESYRRDHSEGQATVPVIVAEKATLVAQLQHWFGDPFGIPILALRGYSSESYEREIRDYLEAGRVDGRGYAALYLGDFDPSGEDIERNTSRYLRDCFDSWHRVAITPALIESYALPESPGKETDSRASAFEARHGRLVQVEVEALDPNDLMGLVAGAIDEFWDDSQYIAVLEREEDDRSHLRRLSGGQA